MPTPPTRAPRGSYREPRGPEAPQSWECSPASPLAQTLERWDHWGSRRLAAPRPHSPSPACTCGHPRAHITWKEMGMEGALFTGVSGTQEPGPSWEQGFVGRTENSDSLQLSHLLG